jgi:hypothetical protein
MMPGNPEPHATLSHVRLGAYAVGLDGTEGEVLRRNAHPGQHIEEGTLADIGKADNADLK